MILRPATMDDAQSLFRWRNEPSTRAASHNTDPVDWKSHVSWLEATLSNTSRKLYIAVVGNSPAGTVRLDFRDGSTEISWTVAPEFRKLGLGSQMVRSAMKTAHGPFCAEIKPENIASRKIAERAGLILQRELNGVLYFTSNDARNQL